MQFTPEQWTLIIGAIVSLLGGLKLYLDAAAKSRETNARIREMEARHAQAMEQARFQADQAANVRHARAEERWQKAVEETKELYRALLATEQAERKADTEKVLRLESDLDHVKDKLKIAQQQADQFQLVSDEMVKLNNTLTEENGALLREREEWYREREELKSQIAELEKRIAELESATKATQGEL